jgi:hypothetical protein
MLCTLHLLVFHHPITGGGSPTPSVSSAGGDNASDLTLSGTFPFEVPIKCDLARGILPKPDPSPKHNLENLPLETDFLDLVWLIWNDYASAHLGTCRLYLRVHVWKAGKAMEELLAQNARFPKSRLWGGADSLRMPYSDRRRYCIDALTVTETPETHS